MKILLKSVLFCLLLPFTLSVVHGQRPGFRAVAFYSTNVERDHVDFARDAIAFYQQLAIDRNFVFDTTSDWEHTNDSYLKNYQVVVWLNEFPHNDHERAAFERYINGGGAWLGFHVSAYNDKDTKWPWFVNFLGGAVFYNNSWPPLPAKLIVDDTTHAVTRNMPGAYTAPINEWYGWKPNPRLNKDVKVLVTLDPANYPLGKKDLIRSGDIPVVWTNTRYRMLYMNMGHGDQNFASALQNKLFENAILWLGARKGPVAPVVYVNQVGFDRDGPKTAVVEVGGGPGVPAVFDLIDVESGTTVYSGRLGGPQSLDEWAPGKIFRVADFSDFRKTGRFRVRIVMSGKAIRSDPFMIEDKALARLTIGRIIHYYNKQRANTPAELAADEHLSVSGSTEKVDLRGGWCDASGDVSKYFSHLAYANFMSPQQTPLVTWSMVSVAEAIPGLLRQWGLKDSLEREALYGADYMMRALSKDDYFYMIVFSFFEKDPHARKVVGLLANSVTTDQYQCAFREGGGMAIAALARIAQWRKAGAFSPQQYLDGAKRAFAHLLINNTRYDDDGKENIIDDYCALMAATELWIATDSVLYRDEARKRAANLERRMSPAGYFIANDANRPFWHASDAGLPVVALARYLDKEKDAGQRGAALGVIRQALDYQLRVTYGVANPFGYARQSFLSGGVVKEGFFIPHDNETGWWWQGENARLASLATAAMVGGRLVYTQAGKGGTVLTGSAVAEAGSGVTGSGVTATRVKRTGGWKVSDSLALYASQQLSWILGCNPYSMCFLYGSGTNNVPYMQSNFGHGSELGGISNGITGRKGRGDGSGIDFRISDEGNEWRWTEQWLPHAAWFLQAVAAMAKE
jgi:type 1 glutamine amidotransferase